MEDSIGLLVVNGFQMVELGSFMDTMKTDAQISKWKTHWCTQCSAVLQRSRAKDDKISTSDMTEDT